MQNRNMAMQGKILVLGCTDNMGNLDGRLFGIFIPNQDCLNSLGLDTYTKYFFPINLSPEDWVCGEYELEFNIIKPTVEQWFKYERRMNKAIQIFPTGIKFLSKSE